MSDPGHLRETVSFAVWSRAKKHRIHAGPGRQSAPGLPLRDREHVSQHRISLKCALSDTLGGTFTLLSLSSDTLTFGGRRHFCQTLCHLLVTCYSNLRAELKIMHRNLSAPDILAPASKGFRLFLFPGRQMVTKPLRLAVTRGLRWAPIFKIVPFCCSL